jgi:ABC-type transport system substrate-binding protein
MMLRRILVCVLLIALGASQIAVAQTAAQTAAPKVLRYAFLVAETGFDPAQVSDLYSRTVIAGIFEAPLAFDFLARPFKMKPVTLADLPTVSDSSTRFTFRVKPGIYFADDPAFKGVKRELVAQDYVYSLKRHYDPITKSPNLYRLEGVKILGLTELRNRIMAAKQPFPYDTEVEGLRALDRYTFEIKLAEPSPRFHQDAMTDPGSFGAVAREVVEMYGDKIMEHPVGTGPFGTNGVAVRASCWHATLVFARCITTKKRLLTMPAQWPSPKR